MHLALENLCVSVCAKCVCCSCSFLPISLSLSHVVCVCVWRRREYVTQNDELLAGDARQALMRDDSVKLDKRIWARGSCMCVRDRERERKREVCACVCFGKTDNDNAP